MRILLFYFAELGGLGGVEVAVVKLSEALAGQGLSSAIVEIAREWKPRRVLPCGTPVWGVAAPSSPTPRRPRSWASFVRSALQLQKILNDFRPDIVHVHYPIAQCYPVVGVSALPHSWKLIVTVHNSDIRVSPFEAPAIRVWQHRLFGRADALTAVSQSLLDDASELYDNFRPKARVIHNGVGPQWFQLPLQPDGKADYVLFVGRLHPVKGVDILLAAWKAISFQFPKTELWIAGDGSERQNLEVLASSLDISSDVRFLGPKTADELPRLYRDARTVVLPSRREGLPISLLEAGACGAICIGTRTPGIPEIIEDGVTGYLVQTESPEELARALARSLQLSSEESSQMRHAARARIARDFSEGQMIKNYMGLYKAMLL